MKCVQLLESWFREPAVTGLESNYQLHLVRILFEDILLSKVLSVGIKVFLSLAFSSRTMELTC